MQLIRAHICKAACIYIYIYVTENAHFPLKAEIRYIRPFPASFSFWSQWPLTLHVPSFLQQEVLTRF